MPDPFIISSTGVVADYNYNTPSVSGMIVAPYNQMAPITVTTPLPGHTFSVRGNGEIPLAAGLVSGLQGTMRTYFTTGTAGGVQPIALLSLDSTGLSQLGILLDSSNRPYFVVKDAQGNSHGVFSPSGSAIAAGVNMIVTFAWNSQAALANGLFGNLVINGVTQSIVSPSGVWTAFAPNRIYNGCGLSGMVDFAGTIAKVDLSDKPLITTM